MKVLYIYDGDWPRGATRVRKQTQALADRGHDVLLLCRALARPPAPSSEPWMQVRSLPGAPLASLQDALTFPFFFNPIWIDSMRRSARDWKADAIVVEDLPLAPAAIAVGGVLDLPVFYDMGEVYPEFLRGIRQFGSAGPLDRLVRDPAAAEVLERWVLPRAQHTFVVSEESRSRAMERGATADTLTIVGNTPEDPEALTAPQVRPPPLAGLEDREIVLFVGIFIFDRGLDDAIRAFARVFRERPRSTLLLVGDGPDRAQLEGLARAEGLADAVRFAGWRPHAELPGYYQRARVGLLPFKDGGQIRFTLANKLFDYLGAGLPVVASDVPPMRRVLEECGGGVLARPENPDDLAAAILRVLGWDDERWQAASRQGRDAVNTRYRWERDAERFVDAIERTIARRRCAG